MAAAKSNDGAEYLSRRGFEAQADRSWAKVVEIISDVYDEVKNPNGYISIGIAENRLMHNELIEQINKSFKLPERMLTYADGGYGSKELRETLAKFLSRYLKSRNPIKTEEVICFPGVTMGIEGLATMVANAGDGILLGRPYYNSFRHDIGLRAGVKTVAVSFGDIDQFGIEAISEYEEALIKSESEGVKVRGLILCSPHNPLGKCYSRDVLTAYLQFCQKHQIHLISDEIYALSIWKNEDSPNAVPFTSILELDIAAYIDPRLVHVLWGVSKDFGANGLRIGCVITKNEPMRVSFIAHSLFTFPSGASDKMIVDLLSDTNFIDTYITENQSRLGHAYTHTTQFLKAKGIPYYKGSNAAFFIWVELRTTYLRNRGRSIEMPEEEGIKIDNELHSKLLDNRVFIGKGSAYGDDLGGWFRIVFTHPDEYLDKGLQKVWEVIKGD